MSDLAKGLAKPKIESQYSSHSPWPAEAWQAAHDAFISGTHRPPPQFPIIISQNSLISTAEKLQQLVNPPTLPEIETTRTAARLWEDLDVPPADDREVQICVVDLDQQMRIENATEGELISVWFKGKRREAWMAESLKQVSQDFNIREAPSHFPIVICQDGLFSTAEKLQEFANLPMLPEIETARIVSISYDNADGAPTDGKEVQICDVNANQKINIKYLTEGETINVWFKGGTRTAWLARSLTSVESIAANF